MNTPFLTLEVAGNRDVVRSGQRARQVAGLLGASPREQSLLAAAVFELARAALRRDRIAVLQFSITADRLRIVSVGDSASLQLPLSQPRHSPDDLAWLARVLDQTTPPGIFEEMTRQNQELLALQAELRKTRAEQGARTAAA